MPCCGRSGRGGCGSSYNIDCPYPKPPPLVQCCGMSGTAMFRVPECPCRCLPNCPPPHYNQCPCLCVPPPSCPGGCCPPICGDSCGGFAPCCPKPAPCKPMVLLTCEPISKRYCCPKRVKILPDGEKCPRPITWPDPPKIDMCCCTTCPKRTIDICYRKVCPNAPRCCPPNYPCAARADMGQCCNRR